MPSMKAVVVRDVGHYGVETVDIDPPKTGEVLVRMKATGICHSDLSIINGTIPQPFPAVIGHEGAGIVEQVGEGVSSVAAGDHVVLSFVPRCGHCWHCMNDEPFLCTVSQPDGTLFDGTTRVHKGDEQMYLMSFLGNMAEYAVVPEACVVAVERDVPFKAAALVGCGVTTGIGAVINTAKVQPGDNVVVFGLGGIGLNVIQGARLVGADMIVGVDINPARKALSEQFGMTHFVNPREIEGDLVAHLVELTGGGADYSFECIGNVNTMRQALECAHKGWGESIIIGVAGAGQEIATRPFQLVTGRVWRGTAFGGARGRTEVPRIVDWYMDGKINIDDLITHTMPLDRINEGFDLMHAGKSIRSVVVY